MADLVRYLDGATLFIMESKFDYQSLLKNPKWQRRRLEVFNRDNFCCKWCKDEEKELHVHHIKYHGKPWECPMEFLITLCCCCHSAVTHIEKDEKKPPQIIAAVKVNTHDNRLFLTKDCVYLISMNDTTVSMYQTISSRAIKQVNDFFKKLYKIKNV